MASAETARLIAELSLKDKLSAGLKTAAANIDKFDSRLSKIGKTAGRGIGTAAKNIEHGAFVAGAAVVGLGAVAVHAAGDFEASLNTINTVAQATPEALADIGKGIRQLSRDTGTSVDDLTAAYYDLVSAGIKTADAQNVLIQANTLAIGGLGTTAEAVDLLTTAINSYGGKAQNAAKFANYFAEAIAAGKTTTSQIAATFAQVGPLAAQFGIGIDQIAAALGVMTATGTDTGVAMTQIRSAMVALMKPNAAMNALMDKTGINFAKVAKQKGLATAYQLLGKEADKAGVPMTKLTGRIEGANFAAQVTGANFAKYNAELVKVQHSSDGAGVAQQQAAQRMQGFNFAVQKLQANLHDAAITIGSELLPPLADLATEATAWLQGHQNEIRNFGKDLSRSLKDAVGWLRSLNWPVITAAFRAGAGFAKDLVTAFTNMPAWVQTAVITGWGLNKLTGGAVGSIIGELGKGLIKGVLSMNAAVVNINAATVNGGGPGDLIGGASKGGLVAALTALFASPAVAAAVGVAMVAGTALAIREIESDPDLRVTSGRGGAYGRFGAVGRTVSGSPFTTPRTAAAAPSELAARHNADVWRQLKPPLVTLAKKLDKPDWFAKWQAAMSKQTEEVRAQRRNARADIAAGRNLAQAAKFLKESGGGATGARNSIAVLKAALKQTHDPKAERAIVAAIHKLRDRLPHLDANQKLLRHAEKIATSNLSTGRKLDKLRATLKDVESPGLRRKLQDLIDKVPRKTQKDLHDVRDKVKQSVHEAKGGITQAQRITTASIRDEKARLAAEITEAATRIVTAIFAAQPIVNATTVVRNTTVNQRAGPTGASRNTGTGRQGGGIA